jgi:hypothetical protein
LLQAHKNNTKNVQNYRLLPIITKKRECVVVALTLLWSFPEHQHNDGANDSDCN